jgi:hypothetical protein
MLCVAQEYALEQGNNYAVEQRDRQPRSAPTSAIIVDKKYYIDYF